MPVLEAREIAKTFPGARQVLKGVSLSVAAGESVAIMGRSGEGKSTLLQILGTLDNPDSGSISIGGKELHSSDFARVRSQNIGFVFQSFYLLEDFSVYDNIAMPAKIARKPVSRARILQLLEAVGLAGRENQLAKTLSGGEKQRASIARALCNDPELVLADEPSGNLDLENAQQIHDLLLGLVKREKKALVLVTHDPHLAERCDRKFELKGGLLFPC